MKKFRYRIKDEDSFVYGVGIIDTKDINTLEEAQRIVRETLIETNKIPKGYRVDVEEIEEDDEQEVDLIC